MLQGQMHVLQNLENEMIELQNGVNIFAQQENQVMELINHLKTLLFQNNTRCSIITLEKTKNILTWIRTVVDGIDRKYLLHHEWNRKWR